MFQRHFFLKLYYHGIVLTKYTTSSHTEQFLCGRVCVCVCVREREVVKGKEVEAEESPNFSFIPSVRERERE